MYINLNNCVPGQKLKSSHGLILEYVAPTTDKQFDNRPGMKYYAHVIKYPTCSYGTRTNDGFVMNNPNSRLEEDHDIAEILPLDYKETEKDIEIKKDYLSKLGKYV